MQKFTARSIAILGVLVALSTVTNILSINVIANIFSISFNHTVNFISGALFGPFFGFLSGVIGDLIGCLIAPKGPFNILITISSGLPGLFSGVAFILYKRFIKKKNAILYTAFSIIVYIFIAVLVTSGLNTYALWLMYSKGKKTFWAYLSIRVPFQLIVTGINLFLSVAISLALKTSLFKDYFPKRKEVENFKQEIDKDNG
ncbi:MAG: folate family ECF transporter S component [Clostridia bacterium]|nr:folate family ECF transporter S component [Clostridia bacterium]